MAIRFRLTLLACLWTACLQAQTSADFLGRMDEFAKTFNSAKVAIKTTDHSKGLDDEVQSGTMIVKKSGMKTQIVIDLTGANAMTVVLGDKLAEIFHPKINEIQEYDIRQYKNSVQSSSSLGFGMSGKEIAANYDIRKFKHEMVGTQGATYLDLVPKSADVQKLIKSIEIWISDATHCPLRQIAHEPGDDTRTTEFSDLQVNPKLPGNAFDLPKSAKRTRMN